MFSLPYFILIAILGLLYLAEKGRLPLIPKKWAVIIAYTLVWFFVGLRGHIMSDFIIYFPYFNNFPDLFHLTPQAFLNRFEPGFNFYTAFIKLFTDNYFVWVAINTLIDLIVISWFFKKYSKSTILSLIFFIAFNGLSIEFNLYRNIKAIDLFFLSVPYLLDRKFLPYLLLNLLGTTFHTTSILYIPIYFIITKEFSVWLVWGGFIVSNIVYLFKIGIIGEVVNQIGFIQNLSAYDKITNYINHGKEFLFSVGYFERTFSFLIFTYYWSRNRRKDKKVNLFYNSYWIYYCSFLLFYEVVVFTERIPLLFVYSYWILYPNVILTKDKIQNIIRCVVMILVVLKIYASFNQPSSKYENILFGASDYKTRKTIVLKDLQKR